MQFAVLLVPAIIAGPGIEIPVPANAGFAQSWAHAAFDHRFWGLVRADHVDAAGLVDYAALAEDTRFLQYLFRLANTTPAEVGNGKARLASWISADNAVVIHGVIATLPTDRTKSGEFSVRDVEDADIDQPGPAFFVGLRFQIGGRRYRLDEIEQGVPPQHAEVTKSDVRFYRGVGLSALDPRGHFAPRCGARGGATLGREACSADRIEAQLDAATRQFVNDRGQAALDRGSRRMRVSRISQWRAEDFAFPGSNPRAGSIAEFLSRRVSDAVPASRLAGGAVAEPRNLGDELLRLRLEAQPSIAKRGSRWER